MSDETVQEEVRKIMDMLYEFDCEIVSYGLAPNPNGFCFERGIDTTKEQCIELSKALDALSRPAELILRVRFL